MVFILATLLGFASHAPGSIGVFDAAMLVALPQFGKEQLLATLVVFRILYFLIPFGISIWIMGTRELWLSVVQPWLERRRLGEACTAKARVRPADQGPAILRPVTASLSAPSGLLTQGCLILLFLPYR